MRQSTIYLTIWLTATACLLLDSGAIPTSPATAAQSRAAEGWGTCPEQFPSGTKCQTDDPEYCLSGERLETFEKRLKDLRERLETCNRQRDNCTGRLDACKSARKACRARAEQLESRPSAGKAAGWCAGTTGASLVAGGIVGGFLAR